MMRYYNVRQAASILGVAYSTVTLHCRKCGIPKFSGAWFIDEDSLARLRESVVGVVGNPNWRNGTGRSCTVDGE